MGSYIPSTREERLSMLESIGMHSFDELYADIPEKLPSKTVSLCHPDFPN